ncbi:MAG: hypothetical protein M3Q89_02990 [Verrucomicrobiota bacterium]|nr:hypothetical protein [Verrucomicrobiota bacterium]
MSDNGQPEKKVPAATTDCPQKDFIKKEGDPLKSDADVKQERKPQENAPPPPLDRY